jgi:hypothetical protein
VIKGKVVKMQKNETPEEGSPCNSGELRTGNDRQLRKRTEEWVQIYEGNKFQRAADKYER